MRFVMERILTTIPVLLGVTLLTFAIVRVTPGDPIALMLGNFATPERIAQLRADLGLDEPLMVQFTTYTLRALQGDFGRSIRSNRPVLDEILIRLPSTLELTAMALLMASVIGIPAGIWSATRPRSILTWLADALALVGLSVPNFWLGILLLIVFGVNLGWVSVIGGDGLMDLLLPAFCLALPTAAVLMRLTRTSVLETLSAGYVRTAHAKGLRGGVVIRRHVLRNALIPIVTILGLQAASLLGGAVIIESVFARPGLGRYAITAILNRDFPQIQGMVLFSAVVYVALNFVVDLLYLWIDPRVRY